MKKQILFILLIFLYVFNLNIYSQQQVPPDWIRQYEGIPLVAPLHWHWVTTNPRAVKEMVDSAGIDVIHLDIGLVQGVDFDPEAQMYTIDTLGLKIIPVMSRSTEISPLLNWIRHYTDAKYSVWEAEGNPNHDANLIMNTSKVETLTDSGVSYIRRKGNVANSIDTLISGPYYRQEINYFFSQDGTCDTIRYFAKYTMKLDSNTVIPHNDTTSFRMDDTVCVIQVTQSYAPTTLTLGCTYVIKERAITRGDFLTLGEFDDFYFDVIPDSAYYRLTSDSCQFAPPDQPEEYYSVLTETSCTYARRDRKYIQFKVIWKGGSNSQGYPQYLLSVDKITVYDVRGNKLIVDDPEGARQEIEQQLVTLSPTYDHLVTGWLGFDEVQSIDQFEPIKKVMDILDENSNEQRPLWLPFMGRWAGSWNQPDNIFGAMGLSPWMEFKKRVGKGNVIQNFYMFDNPWQSNTPDYRSKNILAAGRLNYKQAYDLDPYYGASIQTGEVHNDDAPAHQRNIARHEFLYAANLALMYGAKFIHLAPYFAQRDTNDCESGYNCHAIVDWFPTIKDTIYTDKYNALKDTLSPRLKGLFGKTIKELIPGIDSLNINPSIAYDNVNINYLRKIELVRDQGTEALNSYVDLRFFNNPVEYGDNYFMIINRWYSEPVYNRFRLKLKDLLGYNNWNLKNFMDSTNTTLLPDQNGNVTSPTDTILIGDAILYSIKPVVTDGGTLLADEYAGEGMILNDDMIITNGAKLSIVGNYYAKGNIIIDNGSIDIYTDQFSGTPKIHFQDGKKLIVNGIATINGTSEEKLILDFISPGLENGIVIEEGTLHLSYCEIKNGSAGVIAQPGSGLISIQHSEFIDCLSAGIILLGSSTEGPQAPPPTTVYNCTITGSSNAILAVNYDEIVISQNEINNSDLGIYVAHIPSVHIQGNRIYGNSSSTGSGIFMESCGGYIRTNTVTGHTNGIHLGNSSPDIGGNVLEYNKFHGLYIGYGSFPNMLGFLSLNPPYYFPLSGYNRIKENGMGTISQNPYHNDGSEVYLYYSNALFGTERFPGCNQIADDRASTPTMDTELLISGEVLDTEIEAVYNYWGETDPSQSRFGELAVVFEPYYLDPCPVPEGGEEELIVRTSSGQAVDTLYGVESTVTNYSELELAYANANNQFIDGEMQQAKVFYQQIVQGEYSVSEKLPAYIKLYALGSINGENESYFTALQNTFNDIASGLTDTLLMHIYRQKSILCDVSKQSYLTAITEFDNIIQQDPESEAAVYAEIDIITTSLKMDTTGSQLGKMNGGKYLVKGSSDYLSKLNGLMKDRFGIEITENETVIPKEYVLYQNYPNPFNPTTTIKFDLPKDGVVELGVYDILGRKINTLINEYRNAGSYEQNFNASSLASGIYQYRIKVNDFVSAKKMILVK